MATTTNYTSNGVTRKVDLYVMGAFNFDSRAVQPTSMSMGSETGGQVCAGIVKLAQKVVNYLMSLGVFYDRQWGTGLSGVLLTYSQFQISQEFPSVITSVLSSTLTALQLQELDTDPLDERISSLALVSWNLDQPAGKLTLNLQLGSQSGDLTPIVVPISIVP